MLELNVDINACHLVEASYFLESTEAEMTCEGGVDYICRSGSRDYRIFFH